jgi:molybdopterin/thiamine biosynthesis adenylyltransferase
MEQIFQRNIQFWGEDRQHKLAASSILIGGMGGLGSIVAEGLTRAGIGQLVLVDNQCVEITNLNRQILYDQHDLGSPKVIAAQQKLTAINPQLKITYFQNSVAELKDLLLPHFDGIADCLDNFPARFELEKILSAKHFLVHGGVQNDFGQITTIVPGNSQTLQQLYPGPHISVSLPVVPQTVLLIGSLMVQEILNNLFGEPKLLNKMLIVELVDFSMFKINLKS